MVAVCFEPLGTTVTEGPLATVTPTQGVAVAVGVTVGVGEAVGATVAVGTGVVVGAGVPGGLVGTGVGVGHAPADASILGQSVLIAPLIAASDPTSTSPRRAAMRAISTVA
jgi:hypothetical protein